MMRRSEPEPERARGPKKPRRWRRRLKYALLALALLVLALRIALPPLAPAIAARVGGALGLSVELGDLSLHALAGKAVLRGLVVRAPASSAAGTAGTAEPILRLDYALAQLDLGALLRGRARLRRVEVDGLALRIARRADGRFELSELLAGGAPSETEAERDAADQELRLESPLELDELRLYGLELSYHDASREPPVELRFEASVVGDALGSRTQAGSLALRAHSEGLLEQAQLGGEIDLAGGRARVELRAELDRLRLGPLAPLLEELGLRAGAEELSGGLRLRLDAAPEQAPGEGVRVELALLDASLAADRRTSASLSELRAQSELTSAGASISLVELHGGRLFVRRAPDGAFGFAGLELVGGAAPAPDAPSSPAPPDARPSAPPSAQPGFGLRILERVVLADLALELRDETLAEPEPLALVLDTLELESLRFAPAPADPPATLRLRAHAPGLLAELVVRGELQVFGAKPRASLELRGTGLAPERIAAYLADAGVALSLVDGTIGGRLRAELELPPEGGIRAGSLELGGLVLADAGQELVAMDRLALEDFALDPGGDLRLGSLALEGTRLFVLRDESGAYELAGLRLGAAQARGTSALPEGGAPARPEATPARDGVPAPADPPPAQPPADSDPFRLELGRLRWSGSQIHFVDRARAEPFELRLDRMGLEVDALVIGGPAEPRPPPARMRLYFQAEGLADELVLEGSLQGGGGVALDAELLLRGRGLALEPLAPQLADLGLESRLRAAELDLGLRGGLRLEGGELRGGLELRGLRLADGGEELLALQSLAVRELAVGERGLRIAALDVQRPSIALARDAEGGLLALGLRLRPPEVGQPVEPGRETAPAPGSELEPLEILASEPPSLPAFALGRLSLDGASISWSDEAVAPAVRTHLRARATLNEMELGSERPASFRLELGLEGALGALTAEGRFATDPRRNLAEGRLQLSGLRAGPLAPYLPPGLSIGLADGRLAAAFSAEWSAAQAGGRALRLSAGELALRDGPEGAPLLSVAGAVLDAPRLDLEARVFELAELSLRGLELDTRRTAEGFELLGLVLAGSDDAPRAGEPGAEEPRRADASEAPASAPTASSAPPFWARLRIAEADLPEVALGALDVGIARLSFTDERRAGSAPIELALRAYTKEPQRFSAAELDDSPPALELHVEGALKPLAGAIEARLALRPFLDEPELELDWRVAGIRGAGLVEIAPELAPRVDAGGLEEGELSGRLEGELRWRRRERTDFDFSSGLSGELRLSGPFFRLRPGEEPVAGLDATTIELRRFLPLTGDLHLRSVELERPFGSVLRDERGIHVAGLTILLPVAEGEPAGATQASAPEELAAQAPPAEAPGAGAPPPAADPADPAGTAALGPAGAPPSPELRIDRLRVTGLDLVLEDRTTQPALLYPLVDLDLAVDRFTTRAFAEPHSIAFRVELVGGLVELRERAPPAGLFQGVLGSATSVLRRSGEAVLENRPAFEAIALSGSLAFQPALDGWTQIRVSSLELQSFRTLAAAGGVQIYDGTLDARVDARFEQGNMHFDTRAKMRHLSMSEGANGPISSFLGLGVPLDGILFLLKDAEGAQTLHFTFDVDARDGLARGEIARAASAAVVRVLRDVITSAPQRALTGVVDVTQVPGVSFITSLLGKLPILKHFFGEDEAALFAGSRFELRFEAGSIEPDEYELHALQPLVDALREHQDLGVVLTHELGEADRERAELLGNPSPELGMQLAARLHQRRGELARLRAQLVGELEARSSLGSLSAAGLEELRRLDRELGASESALDETLGRLRPGAERRRDRRTREAALSLAMLRLERLRESLVRAVGEEVAARVEFRPPRYGKELPPGGGRVELVAVLRR